MSTANLPSPAGNARPKTGVLRWAFRIFRWTTYLAALITLILLLHKSPPPLVEATPQAAARAEEKFAQVEQSVAQGQQATVRLDETELNSYLVSHLDLKTEQPAAAPTPGATPGGPGSPTPEDVEKMRSSVRDVKVTMADDRVKAYVVFDVHGKDMTLELEGKLSATNGYLQFVPVSGHIGSLPIPQSTLETAVQRLMESPENREKLRLPPDISDLHIENGELVATYK
ncbi:MAG: hypothetical protein ABSE19_08445 [Candidatus Acidiferrum sp.]